MNKDKKISELSADLYRATCGYFRLQNKIEELEKQNKDLKERFTKVYDFSSDNIRLKNENYILLTQNKDLEKENKMLTNNIIFLGQRNVSNQPDKLDKMLQMQYDLDCRIDPDYGVMVKMIFKESENDSIIYSMEKKRNQKIKDSVLAEQAESIEFLNCFEWKPWKKNQVTNIEEAKKELVDRFHFILSDANTIGMTGQELFDKYLEKNEINHKRQDENY